MPLEFEWDTAKAVENARKHRVTFAEAAAVFADSRSITVHDSAHSDEEDRWIILGLSGQGRLVVVVFVERGDKIRIVSARRATKRETNDYNEVQGK
ncbi:MAG: BrnT family toxin [Planctomycetes bacterium]|nr:BrnT family toxin [Planctomycetota bacterium]